MALLESVNHKDHFPLETTEVLRRMVQVFEQFELVHRHFRQLDKVPICLAMLLC